MTSFRNHVGVFAAVVALAIVVGPREAFAQNPNAGSAPVTIVNPLPVPVTGTVTVTNSPTTTTIDNPGTNPVLIRDVDVSRREPVQFRGIPTSFSGGSGATTLVTVPAGKTLVIEHVSGSVNLQSANGVFSCGLGTTDSSVGFDSMICQAMGFNALNHIHVANASTKFYVSAGKTVKFFVEAISLADTGFVSAFASGYYIPAP